MEYKKEKQDVFKHKLIDFDMIKICEIEFVRMFVNYLLEKYGDNENGYKQIVINNKRSDLSRIKWCFSVIYPEKANIISSLLLTFVLRGCFE